MQANPAWSGWAGQVPPQGIRRLKSRFCQEVCVFSTLPTFSLAALLGKMPEPQVGSRALRATVLLISWHALEAREAKVTISQKLTGKVITGTGLQNEWPID